MLIGMMDLTLNVSFTSFCGIHYTLVPEDHGYIVSYPTVIHKYGRLPECFSVVYVLTTLYEIQSKKPRLAVCERALKPISDWIDDLFLYSSTSLAHLLSNSSLLSP